MWWRRLAEVQTEHQNGEERGFKRLWTWNGCWCQTGLVWVFQKLLIYWDFHAQPSLGFTENGPKKRKYPVSSSCVDEEALLMSEENGQDWLEMIERATVTQITTRYNQGIQNTISERTTHRTLKHMGYSSRRPHRVPLLSTKNRKHRLQFAQAHQNRTIEDCKNVAWSDESRFLLQHSDGRVRIWCKEHESMDPSCLVSTVQTGGGGVMVWGIFSWHNLGPLVPIEYNLNTTAYLSIVADHVHPFITTVDPSSKGYFQQDNAPCHKAQIISDWFLEHDNEFNLLKWPPQSPDLSPIEQLWDVVEREIRIMDVQLTTLQQLHDFIMSIWTKISEECFQHLVESMPRRIKAVLKAKGGPTRY